MEQKNDTFLEMGIFDDGPFEVGDENIKDPQLAPTPPNSYLGKIKITRFSPSPPGLSFFFFLALPGFSLDKGKRLVKQGQLTVVAGAPRAYHSGAVVLLRKGDDTSNIVLKDYILEGEGLASSFGYSVAVLDLNGDK